MRILYVAMKYDYGRRSQGPSFEHYNFYHALLGMGHDLIYFDFMTLLQEHGRASMNQRLLEVARTEKPDMMFAVLFTDELDQASLRKVTEDIGIPTLNWFCDDHWRFENYSRHWAPCFRWVVTTAQSALPKYAKMGYRNVIKSQWACNTLLYKPLNAPLLHDVTFVGQPYGNRRDIIEQVRKAGINVRTWGSGWDSGRVSQDEMIRIFNQSRINLNLATAYGLVGGEVALPRPTPNDLVARILDRVPFMREIRAIGKSHLKMRNPSDVVRDSLNGFDTAAAAYPEQIKGRNFEVPGCGGFLLTGEADNLREYYEIGKEVACFQGTEDMIEKVHYYLRHESERARIAQAGYERTVQVHTYVHRFTEVFRQMGLPVDMTPGVSQQVRSGCTIEVQ